VKKCTKCGEEKSLDEFFNRDSKVRDGKNSHCKVCERLKIDEWRKNNTDTLRKIERRAHLKRNFGITVEQYDELLHKQNECCAICDRHASEFRTRLAVDHDHHTGRIRGLLCTTCNHRLIGRHRNAALLRKMADYVEGGTDWYVPDKRPKRKKKKKK
jgi:hypothetical protein